MAKKNKDIDKKSSKKKAKVIKEKKPIANEARGRKKTDNVVTTKVSMSDLKLIDLKCVCGMSYELPLLADVPSHKLMVCSNCTPLKTKQERIINTNTLIEKIKRLKRSIK